MSPKLINHITAVIYVKAANGLITKTPGDIRLARSLCISASDLCVRDAPSVRSCEAHVETLTALIGS